MVWDGLGSDEPDGDYVVFGPVEVDVTPGEGGCAVLCGVAQPEFGHAQLEPELEVAKMSRRAFSFWLTMCRIRNWRSS